MYKNNEQRKAEILAAIKDEEAINISLIQKTFDVGFPMAGEIYAEEMNRRSGRAELHLHTYMTAFGGLDQAGSFFASASKRGVNAIAVTDLGSVQSYLAADCAGKEYGVKPIFGAEFYIEEGEGAGSHRVVALAKNRDGVRKIYDLVTLSQTDFQKESIPFLPMREIVKGHRDLYMGLVSCDRKILSLLDEGGDDAVRNLFFSFDYIEITTPEVCSILLGEDSLERCRNFLRRIALIAADAGIPVIATDDACYVKEKDDPEAGALDYSRRIDPLRQRSIREPSMEGRHFRPTKEMLDCLSFLGEETARELVIDGPNRISAQIEWASPFRNGESLIPLFDDADERIAEICRDHLKAWFADGRGEEREERLKKELKAIERSHSASALLTFHFIAEKAKEDGHITSTRGMAGNSFVAYLLGITNLNPLEHGLPMEMLFGAEGDRVPDIDMEFATDYLGSIHDYFVTLFGKDNIARAGMVMNLPRRSAVLRVQEYEKDCKARFDTENFEGMVDALRVSKRTMGLHPCGYVVLPKGHKWNEFTPLEYPSGAVGHGRKITHYPWHELSACGRLYKFDMFGHGALNLLERLAAETGVDVNGINLDDQRLVDLLCGRNPETTFEMVPGCQGETMREVVSLAKPSTFSDLVKVKGLVHGTGVWEYYKDKLASGERKISEEMVTNRDDLFLSLLSHGVERGLALMIAERVRKGRGLTRQMKEAMKGAQLPDSFIEACENVIYLFPKAHIIGLLNRELRLAYFKLNHPEKYERIYHELFD